MARRSLNLSEIHSHLGSRSPAAAYNSPISVVRGKDASPVSLAYDTFTHPLLVNKGEASVSFVISSDARDRHGDIVRPRGCEAYLEHYKRNPIVLFGHRSLEYPIALAESPSGELCVWPEDHVIKAKAFFHQKTRESVEVYTLLAEGVLRGTSIGFIPHEAYFLDSEANTTSTKADIFFDTGGLDFVSWELTEFSVLPLGANRDALACCLSGGMVKSKVLQELLLPYSITPTPTFSGWSASNATPTSPLSQSVKDALEQGTAASLLASLTSSPITTSTKDTMSDTITPDGGPLEAGKPAPALEESHKALHEKMDKMYACMLETHEKCKALHEDHKALHEEHRKLHADHAELHAEHKALHDMHKSLHDKVDEHKGLHHESHKKLDTHGEHHKTTHDKLDGLHKKVDGKHEEAKALEVKKAQDEAASEKTLEEQARKQLEELTRLNKEISDQLQRATGRRY